LSAAQLSKQVSVLETINRLAATMAETQDEQILLDAGAEALTRTVGVDHCGILMLNPALTGGTVVSEYPAHGAVGTHFDIPDNLLQPIIQNSDASPILIKNTEADPSLKEGSKSVLRNLGVNSVLIIPMFVHGRCIGSAGLDIYGDERSFTPEMVETARTITAQVVIGLQNIRLFNDAHRRAEQLQRITAFGQSVEATLDLAAIFESMLAESARMLPQDQISVSLYDVPSGKLRVAAEHVSGKTTIDLDGGDSVPITGQIATVWNNWELLHIADVPVEAGAPTTSSIRSWILVPLLSRGRILGIVSVGCVRPYAYSETDVALFQQMVNQFAVAIENAQAFAQSQRMARNESLVNEISGQIQRQMDIQRMMDVTVNQLGKALGARRGRIRLGVKPPNGEQE
jgi:GAF domain-containing protein